MNLLRRMAAHPFAPDEEGGIYAVLDENGEVFPITSADDSLLNPSIIEIARDYVDGYWIIMTTFEASIFADDPPSSDWFKTVVFNMDTDTDRGEDEEFRAVYTAPTVKEALRNHGRGLALAEKLASQ